MRVSARASAGWLVVCLAVVWKWRGRGAVYNNESDHNDLDTWVVERFQVFGAKMMLYNWAEDDAKLQTRRSTRTLKL